MIYLKIKLDNGAIKPTKAHEEDAGFDLYSRENVEILPGESALFDTGVHVEIPNGMTGFLKSKSGLNCKYSIVSEGVIDSGYSGSIIVKLYNHGKFPYKVLKGDKISQIVFLPIPSIKLRESNLISEGKRGDSGFGSSGR